MFRQVLVAALLVACDGDPFATEAEICAETPFSLSDGTRFTELNAAVEAAAKGDGEVSVCEGKHLVSHEVYSTVSGAGTAVRIGGAGMERTELVGRAGVVVLTSYNLAALDVRDLALAQTSHTYEQGDCDVNMDAGEVGSDYCGGPGYPWGAATVEGTVTLERVAVRDSSGFYGGGLVAGGLLVYGSWEGSTVSQITLRDCVFERNQAWAESVGGAVHILANNQADGLVTLVSENTDWGEGDDDNSPDDLAITYDNEDGEVIVDAQYSWDGVASFTCDPDTARCE